MGAEVKISVIMSVYNGEAYLAEAIESVMAQSLKDFELVIINDCSTDATSSILADYAARDKRIKVHHNEVNLKLPTSLNKAISLSCGKYIARMDADDICLPDRLEKQYQFMEENRDIDLSSCRFMTLKNGVYMSGGCGGRCDNEALCAMLLVTNPILHPGVIAKAEVMKETGYDTSLTCTEDLELWTRMAMQNRKMAILPECLLLYRLHDKQITSTTLDRQRKEVLAIQKKYYGFLGKEMDAAMEEFYIGGIYFNKITDVNAFLAYAKWLRSSMTGLSKGAIDYALCEVWAEYKRGAARKLDIVKALCMFSPIFLFRELGRRKKAAKTDIEKCRRIASHLGLKQTAGTKAYPVFEK